MQLVEDGPSTMRGPQITTGRVAVLCVAQVPSLAGYSAVPALLPLFVSIWSLSNVQAGWLAGAFFLGYMCAVVPLVALTDHLPPRRIYLASALLNLACYLGFAMVGGLRGACVPGSGWGRSRRYVHARAARYHGRGTSCRPRPHCCLVYKLVHNRGRLIIPLRRSHGTAAGVAECLHRPHIFYWGEASDKFSFGATDVGPLRPLLGNINRDEFACFG